jgi:hypothetical protein
MYLKLNNGIIENYPYSIGDLRRDNPQTSFPASPTDTLLAEWGMYPVTAVEKPSADYTKNVTELDPVLTNGKWVQTWEVTNASAEEIAERKAELNAQADRNRINAYREESDPIFFKWQRGEATEQEWLDKIAEIKARYPDIV